MFMRAKLLLVLGCIVFSVYSGFKYWLKFRKAKQAPPSVERVVQEIPSTHQELSPLASALPDGEMVSCDSWGTNTGEIWGYGDGLMFRGFPDDWKSGRPVFERWRGEPL